MPSLRRSASVILSVIALSALAGTPALASGPSSSDPATTSADASGAPSADATGAPSADATGAGPTTSGDAAGAGASSTSSPSPSKKPTRNQKVWPKAPDGFTPHTGVRLNDPYNRAGHSQGEVRRAILRSINSTVHGDMIKASTWNFRGWPYADALSNAAKRGVVVRVLIAQGNAPGATKNPEYAALRTRLQNSSKRYRARGVPASWARWCDGSCRGFGGILHTKMVLFDHIANHTRNVVMYGSNNLTSTAVTNQWNDWFTLARNADAYDFFSTVFRQMTRDHHVLNGAYLEKKIGGTKSVPRYDFSVYPDTGKRAPKGDPIVNVLNRVRCNGATNVAGGHTQVRIGQDAIAGQRGMKIAARLAQMERNGCGIRIVYTLMGDQVHDRLAAAGIPMTHMAYDTNRDGAYDKYLHMKVMAIKGVYAGQKNAFVVTNGTANWTALPLHSDEIASVITAPGIAKPYFKWITWLMVNRPASWKAPDLAPVAATDPGIDGRVLPGATATSDPYRLIRGDL